MDEFQDAVKGLTRNEREKFLSILKGMCGHPTYMSFFAFGTPEAIVALGKDPAYVRRFDMYEVTPWSMVDAEYLNFLETLEEIIPLAKMSNLRSPELSSYIYEKTGGVIGKVCELVKAGACYGVSLGLEQITLATLKKAEVSKWLAVPREMQ